VAYGLLTAFDVLFKRFFGFSPPLLSPERLQITERPCILSFFSIAACKRFSFFSSLSSSFSAFFSAAIRSFSAFANCLPNFRCRTCSCFSASLCFHANTASAFLFAFSSFSNSSSLTLDAS